MNRALRYLLVTAGGISSILLFLLVTAAGNTGLFEEHYPWLMAFNAIVTLSLLALVIWLLLRLFREYRRGKFGSRLLARLVLLFALVGVLPGLTIYIVSVQFVSRSIESWFDVRVESALESGLTLGRNALDSSLRDLSARARSVAQELANMPESEQVSYLTRLHEPKMEVSILSPSGQILTTVGNNFRQLAPHLPSPSSLRKARSTLSYSAIESEEDSEGRSSIWFNVIVPIPAPARARTLGAEPHFLQIVQPVPDYLAHDAETLRHTYTEYQQRAVGRTGLRKIYIITLTLTLLLAIFGAVACAFAIARNLARPLLLLAAGTKAVAEGNLSPKPIVTTKDELGTLTQSFNDMTSQLLEARISVDKNRAALEQAKAYLESVLASMSAGVLVLDKDFRIVSSNESVRRILNDDFTPYIGQPLHAIDAHAAFADAVISAFSEQHAQMGQSSPDGLRWQQQIDLPLQQHGKDITLLEGSHLTLLARGSHLPVNDGVGYVIVFDDITDVISAQRSAAWGEVVRRLAHEIKNPLTPIQLSAERLQMRLANKLEPADAAILDKSTATIVNQVTAMKHMVDDFRNYAKLPPPRLQPTDLHALVTEILHLYQADDRGDTIHFQAASDLPQVMADPTQLRQVIHNLLQNAQDAVADHANDTASIDITLETVTFQGLNGSGKMAVKLAIADNGPGFSPQVLARAFEPYVTSKPRGTGLGLPMVKKIIDEHEGRVDIQNRTDMTGARIVILLPMLAD